MAYNSLQEGVSIGVRTTLGHESFKGALKDGFINIGVSSISAFIANKIGQGRLEQLRGTNTVSDYVLHKMYHGILGAAQGVAFAALRGENVGSAALGGAVGGIVAEVVAEGIGMLAGGTMAKGAKYAGKAIKAAEKVLPESVTKAVGKTLGKAANSAGGVLKEATVVLDSAKGKVKATVKSGLGVRGKKPVKNMTDHEYIQSMADRANRRFAGKGPQVGTEKHRHAEKLHKRYQKMTGERPHLEAEKRFADGGPWEPGYGTKGSSRADMYSRKTGEAFDYKFGEAKLSSGQRKKYETNLPKVDGKNAPVHTIKPTQGTM